MRLFLHIAIPIALILCGVFFFNGMKKTQEINFFGIQIGPEKQNAQATGRSSNTQRPAFQSRAMTLEKINFMVNIHSQGQIRTHNATTLTAQVSGRIKHIAPNFQDGAFFKRGDTLLEIEKEDYLTELAAAQAQLARAKAGFAQEKARAKQALLNWKDAGFKDEPSDLVLRKPQLHEAEANVSSAESSLQRAKRNLQRTSVRAPYDGRVRTRSVGPGQQVNGSTPLGEIFSTDFAEVRLPLTTRDLTLFTPPQKPGETGKQGEVLFTSILNTGTDNHQHSTWKGTILRAEGELDKNSKQLFVIAKIDDPFALKSEAKPLFIGQPVRASIPAKLLKDVYLLPRKHLSGLNEILLIREGQFKRLKLTPLWSDQDTLITRDGIRDGDLLAISNLPYAPDGAPVEIISPKEDEQTSKKTSSSRKLSRK